MLVILLMLSVPRLPIFDANTQAAYRVCLCRAFVPPNPILSVFIQHLFCFFLFSFSLFVFACAAMSAGDVEENAWHTNTVKSIGRYQKCKEEVS